MVVASRVQRGCVYWVDFDPVRGSEQGKRRPALVIQNDLGNQTSSTTIVVAITSRLPTRHYPMHVPVTILGRQAVILCEQIRTVSLERVDPRPVVRLTPEQMTQVEEAIRCSLGLPEVTARF